MLPKLVRAALSVSALGLGAAACGGGDGGGTGTGPGSTTADLAITNTDSLTLAIDGTSLVYTIVVTNLGPNPVTGARVDDAFPARVSSIIWTCAASPGSSCPAGGSGTIAATVNLLAAGTATFTATGTVTGTGALSNTASVTAPGGIYDPPGNNSATDNDTQITLAAQLRVLHASPEAPSLDVVVSGRILLTNLAYKSASAYLPVPAAALNVQARSAGTSTTIVTATPTLAAGRDYTLVTTGLAASPTALVLADTNTAPTGNNGKVRIVHASPAAGTMDVYVWPPALPIDFFSPVLSNVTFQTVSPYVSAPVGTYRVRLTPPGSKTALFDSTLTIVAGQVRTGVAVDRPGGGRPVGAVVLADLN